MLHSVRLLVVAIVLLSGVVVNVRGAVAGWSVSHLHWEHGWPLTWLGREWLVVEVKGTGPLGLFDPAWLWNTFPGQEYGYSTFYLTADIAAIGMLCAGTYFAFPRTPNKFGRFQFGIRTLLVVQAIVCAVVCLICFYPITLSYIADVGIFLGVMFTLITAGKIMYKVPASVRQHLITESMSKPEP